jgi:hypothetical protein
MWIRGWFIVCAALAPGFTEMNVWGQEAQSLPAAQSAGNEPCSEAVLISQLGSKTAQERDDALYALAKLGKLEPQSQDAVRKFLKAKRWQERHLAVYALGKSDPTMERVGGWLTPMMGDNRREVSNGAFGLLWDAGKVEVVAGAIASRLQSKSMEQRYVACGQVAQMVEGQPIPEPVERLFPVMVNLMETDPSADVQVRAMVAVAGWKEKAVAIVPTMLKRLDTVGQEYRPAIFEVLLSLAADDPHVVALMNHPDGKIQWEYRAARIAWERKSNPHKSSSPPSAAVAGKGFTGVWVVRDETGRVVEETEYRGGLREGTSKAFGADGKLAKSESYRQGKRHGLARQFKAGELANDQMYADGVADGAGHVYRGEEVLELIQRFGVPWKGGLCERTGGKHELTWNNIIEDGEHIGSYTWTDFNSTGLRTLGSIRMRGSNPHVTQILLDNQDLYAKTPSNGQPLNGTFEVIDPVTMGFVKREFVQGRVKGTGPLPDEYAVLWNPRITLRGALVQVNRETTAEDLLSAGVLGNTKELSLMTGGASVDGFAVVEHFPKLQVLKAGRIGLTGQAMKSLKGVERLEELWLFGNPVGDAGMAHIAHLTSLKMLWADQIGLTDAGMAHVGKMTDLSELRLYDNPITDAGLAKLGGLTKLRTVWLQGTNVGDEALASLLPSKGSLVDLDLMGTKVTDQGLAHVREFTALHTLRLAGTQVTDAAIPQISGMKNLSGLVLNGTKVTAAGLRQLKGLDQLTHLGLAGLAIQDADLEVLEALPELYALELTNTKITDGALARLRKLPKLRVLYVGGTLWTSTEEFKKERPDLVVQAN